MILENSRLRSLLSIGLTILLAGCAAGTVSQAKGGPEAALPIPALLAGLKEHDAYSSDTRQLVENGLIALNNGAYAEARSNFNQALKLDTANSRLHFLNALTYHLAALNGDSSLFELAEQGYQLSVKFDPTNWSARHHLGLLYLDQKKFVLAQEQLAEALLFNDHDPDLLYSMAVASYYAWDPVTADGALRRLHEIEGDSERVLRATCMVQSALGDQEQSRESLKRYSERYKSTADAAYLDARMTDWKKLYGYLGRSSAEATVPSSQIVLASSSYSSGSYDSDGGYQDQRSFGERYEPLQASQMPDAAKKMVIVDVVMVQTEEYLTTTKGVNLLNGLALQFGSPDGGPGYSWAETRSQASSGSAYDVSKTITRALNIPAITYSLNIFNTHSDRAEILARPTLVAMDGEESTFFSGRDIQAATVGNSTSTYSSGSVQISEKVGVTLELIPTFLDDNSLKLAVHAQRRFLKTPSNDIVFENKIETTETDVYANVLINFGETLVLSGLSEKETERLRDGVPFLQDLPGVQYLFSRNDTADFQRSVLILLTPRPPQYVYQNTDERQAGASTGAGKHFSLSELQARYSDWFKPYPNWASVFHHLQSNSLYREFRTGDVTLERWANQQSLGDRLQQALDFLYY